VPVFIEKTAEVKKAVSDILTGTCFDNGTICASEQAVVVDAPIEQVVREQFTKQGGHFLNESDAQKIAEIILTPQRTLNSGIVGKSAAHIASLAGVSIPTGTRCLLADCGGVGRDFPWSVEKLSPLLAFFVVEGIEQGADRCEEILQFGGMGHTAGMHTQNREAAVLYGQRMPASRVIINSPTTHGAIGFSTALSPSMTLGCGSWGGNVTSDNVSPHHLMDIKRVAFETQPVNAVDSKKIGQTNYSNHKFNQKKTDSQKYNRDQIVSIVDKFLSKKLTENPKSEDSLPDSATSKTIIHQVIKEPEINELKPDPREFVSEDDVRTAINKGEKIYISKKTILTPSAKDLGWEKEIFAEI
jgi:hypothetical protein